MDNISVQDKELDQLLEKVNKALNVKQAQISNNVSKLKEAAGSQEADIKDWVSSTIDDWRSSWDDSREGAESAKYDLETAVDWFLNNLDQFEENYGYALDAEGEALVADIAQSYADETLEDLRSSWDHFEDSDEDEFEDDEDDSEDDEDEDFEDEESWDESLAVTRSKIREYKHSNLEQLFNKIDNTLKEADTYLVSKGYRQLQEAVVTPQDIVSDYISNHPEAKNRGQELITHLIQLQKQDPNTDLNVALDDYLTKYPQAPAAAPQAAQTKAAPQAKLITAQDAKLGQAYLSKALMSGAIPKKINQLLPKISPTFKGDNFTITKISRVPLNSPSSMRFKVDFELQGGSKKANKFLDSQDPITCKATQFLQTLQEEQLSEGVMGNIGAAVGQALGNIKRGVSDLKAGVTNNTQLQGQNAKVAMAKEPMVAQYIQKAIAQAFKDAIPINGKNFEVSVSNITANVDKNAEAELQLKGSAADKEAQEKAEQRAQAKEELKGKVKDAAAKGVEAVKKGAKALGQKASDAAAKGAETIKKGAKALGQQASQGLDKAKAALGIGNSNSESIGSSAVKESFSGSSDNKLMEGLLVKKGSFTIDMAVGGAVPEQAVPEQNQTQPEKKAQQTQPEKKVQQSEEKTQQSGEKTQPVQAIQQQAQQPNGQSINIYNNGYPQQGQPGQPQQRVQNTGIPDWNSLNRGQKKFLRKANKAAKAAGKVGRNPGNGNFGNNVWDLTYGNGGKYGSNWA